LFQVSGKRGLLGSEAIPDGSSTLPLYDCVRVARHLGVTHNPFPLSSIHRHNHQNMSGNLLLHFKPVRTVGLRATKFSSHWRGHAFLFEKKAAPTYRASAGLRVPFIFVVLEGLIGPRLSLFRWLHFPLPPVWLRVPVMLVFALLLVRFVAGLNLSQIGLYRWREWTGTEKSYFIQVFLIANLVFAALFADRLQMTFSEPSPLLRVWAVFIPYFLWGF